MGKPRDFAPNPTRRDLPSWTSLPTFMAGVVSGHRVSGRRFRQFLVLPAAGPELATGGPDLSESDRTAPPMLRKLTLSSCLSSLMSADICESMASATWASSSTEALFEARAPAPPLSTDASWFHVNGEARSCQGREVGAVTSRRYLVFERWSANTHI